MDNPFIYSKWVWLGNHDIKNSYINFYSSFTTGKTEKPIKIYISADSQYAVYINDIFAGCGQYPDYPDYKIYDSIDISCFAKTGENSVKICAYYQGEDSSTYRKGEAGVIYSIACGDTVLLASGIETLACRNKAYKSGNVPKITQQLSYSFEYDANMEDFLNKKADISQFVTSKTRENDMKLVQRAIKKTEILENKPVRLLSQGVFLDKNKLNRPAERMQKAYLSNKNLIIMTGLNHPASLPLSEGIRFDKNEPEANGIYIVIDLCEEDTGYVSLDLELKNAAEILIGFGEHLDDLRVRTSVGGRSFCAIYKAAAGRRQFVYPFKRVGLRYLQLNIYSDEITVYYAGIKPVRYPVSGIPYFHCSDHLHNEIYKVSKRTLLLCMHDHYEDCPWREQALYSMDSRNQMLCGYYCFGEFDFAKANLKLMALSLRKDTMLELCSPARVSVTIPSFSAVFVLQLYEYLLYSGDIAFATEVLSCAKAITDGFISRIDSDDGLLKQYNGSNYWNFYEWQNGLDGFNICRNTESQIIYDAPLNAFVSIAIKSLSNIYDLLGQKEKSSYYKGIKEELNKNIHNHFWDKQKKAYATYLDKDGLWHYSELANSLIVCCGACSDGFLDEVLEKIYSGNLIPVSLSYNIFKYEALLKLPDKYSVKVFENIADVWGNMLFKGATTFWETEKGQCDFENAGSLCHGWSAIPVYFYFAYALGIKPDPGDITGYRISPVKSGLYDIYGRIIFPDGRKIELPPVT